MPVEIGSCHSNKVEQSNSELDATSPTLSAIEDSDEDDMPQATTKPPEQATKPVQNSHVNFFEPMGKVSNEHTSERSNSTLMQDRNAPLPTRSSTRVGRGQRSSTPFWENKPTKSLLSTPHKLTHN